MMKLILVLLVLCLLCVSVPSLAESGSLPELPERLPYTYRKPLTEGAGTVEQIEYPSRDYARKQLKPRGVSGGSELLARFSFSLCAPLVPWGELVSQRGLGWAGEVFTKCPGPQVTQEDQDSS